MISFQEYFEKRVEELIGNSGNQTFFVFRGFEIEQIKYLVSHPNSILNDTALVQNGGYELKSDVMKIPHHGGKSSYQRWFYNEVQPTYAVISCGKDNERTTKMIQA